MSAARANTSQNAAAGEFADTVQTFYSDLNSRDYQSAYALMSSSFQSGSPYNAWLSGYASTISSRPLVEATGDPSVLAVTLVARERLSSVIYTTVYRGKLRGVQAADGTWQIDSGYFNMVSRARE